MKILTDPRSGSYQGITSSRNRYGQYVRTRAIPVQPRTTRQGQVRGVFGASATQWRGLTDAQRAAWANMAANYAYTDSLGQGYTLTGSQFYQSAQLSSIIATGADWGATAPVDLSSFVVDANTYVMDAEATVAALELNFDPTPLPTDHFVIIESTGPVSPGVSSPPGPHYWRNVSSIAPAATSPAAILTPYVALFGALAAGQKIFFRLAEYDANAARRSAWATISAIVIA